MVAAVTPPSRALPTTTSSTSRSVRSLATASSSGTSPLSGTSALAVATIAAGHAREHRRDEDVGLDADRHDA